MKRDHPVIAGDRGDFDLLPDGQPLAQKGREVAHRWRTAKGIAAGNPPWPERASVLCGLAGGDEIRLSRGQELRTMVEGESVCTAS